MGLYAEPCFFLLCGNALNFSIKIHSSTEDRTVPWAIMVERGDAE